MITDVIICDKKKIFFNHHNASANYVISNRKLCIKTQKSIITSAIEWFLN